MDFDKLREMWKEDSIIDKKMLDSESLKSSILHSKWYNILIDCKIEHKKIELEYAREKLKAKSYYSGDYTQEDKRFKSLGHQHKKLKTNEDMNDYVSADSDLQRIKLKLFVAEEKIQFILNVINQINARSFQISNAIKWAKFMNGDNS